MGTTDDEYMRVCPYCKLAYIPDSRIYKDAEVKCPRCGRTLIEDDGD